MLHFAPPIAVTVGCTLACTHASPQCMYNMWLVMSHVVSPNADFTAVPLSGLIGCNVPLFSDGMSQLSASWHGMINLMDNMPCNTWAWEYTENALKIQCFCWTEHLWKATANKIFQSVTNFITLALGHPVYKHKVSRQNYIHNIWLS